MNKNHLQITSLILLLALLLCDDGYAQIGIGTTTPNPDALLDIDATTAKGGVLMPRIALTSTTSAFPLVNHVAGMTLYNTATTTGANKVSPGYYYNNGVKWLRLITEADVDTKAWSTEGNAGTSSATNFIGTTDNQAIVVKTNNTNRFRFTETGSLHSYGNGTATLPSYAWNSSFDTGIFKPNDQSIGFTTSGVEKLRIPSTDQIYAMRWGTAARPFYSFDDDKGAGMYLVGGGILGFSAWGGEKFRMTAFGQLQSSNNGANTIPSYSWVNAPRTGILMPLLNTIAFSTDGTQRLRIPDSHQIYAMNGGTVELPFYSFNASQSTGIYSPNVNRMALVTNGIERIRLDHDGTVGIGTQVPWEALHVVGNLRVDGAFKPNGDAGQSGRLLQSTGTNTAPVWGPRIRKFETAQYNLTNGNRRIIEYGIAGITRSTTVIVTIQGNNNWDTPHITFDYVIVENGLVRIVVQNNTSSTFLGDTYTGARFNITVID